MKTLKEFQQGIFECPDIVYVDIFSVNTVQIIQRRVNASFLANFNNDLSVYLDSLKSRYDRVIVRPRKKRGTSSQPYGEQVTVNLTNTQSAPSSTPKNTVTAETPTAQPALPIQPLNGMAGNSFGLNGEQVLSGYFAQKDNERLKAENEQLKKSLIDQKNEFTTALKDQKSKKNLYKEKYEKLDRKLERMDYEADKEPSKLDKLIDGAIANPEMIPHLMGAFQGLKGATTPTTQIAVNQDESLSESAKFLINVARTYPENFTKEFAQIIQRYDQNDTAFVEHLRIKLTPLKKVENG